MEENRSVTKLFFGAGLIVALVLMLTSFKVYAYDDIPLEFNWIYKKNGDSAVYTWNNGYAYNIEGLNYIGMECGFPVPHYAEAGQYSLYFHFKFTCDQSPKPLFRMSISPYNSSLSIYPSTSSDNYILNQLGSANLFGELDTYNANLKNYYGTFRWMSKSTCNFNWVCLREKSPDYSNQYTYSVIGIMDLRLMEEDEMSPFRLGIEIANAQSYSTFTVYNVDMGLHAMDSSETWALYDCWNKLDEISSKLDDLSITAVIDTSTIESYLSDILSRLVTDTGKQQSILEAIGALAYNLRTGAYDVPDPDPDLTEWDEHNAAVASAASDLHDLEESLVGTLSDYEFPTVSNQTAVNNVLLPFWNNELVIALTLAMMSLMIVFLIL